MLESLDQLAEVLVFRQQDPVFVKGPLQDIRIDSSALSLENIGDVMTVLA